MGYYRLGARTAVRLRDGQGREVLFDLLDPIRERTTGAVALRVEPAQLASTGEPRTVSLPTPVAVARSRDVGVRRPPITRKAALGSTAPSSPAPVPAEPTLPAEAALEESRTPDPLPVPVEEPPRRAPTRASSNPVAGFLPTTR
jgi:hypothetical protein